MGGWAAVPSDRGGAVGRGSRREERSGVVRAGWLGSNVSRPILASVYHFGFVFWIRKRFKQNGGKRLTVRV